MAETVALCARDDLAPGEARRFDVAGRRIALVRIGDDFYAVDDQCSHEDYSLAEGEVWADECEIECPRHGSTFDLRDRRALLAAGHPAGCRSTRSRSTATTWRWCCRERRRTCSRSRGLHAAAGGREVLHGIDLAVRSGEVHVVMGPNGSGKSTLAHALWAGPAPR